MNMILSKITQACPLPRIIGDTRLNEGDELELEEEEEEELEEEELEEEEGLEEGLE